MTGQIGPVRVTGTAAWDTDGRRLDEAGLIAMTRSESGRIVSFGYRRRAAIDVDQTDIGIYAPSRIASASSADGTMTGKTVKWWKDSPALLARLLRRGEAAVAPLDRRPKTPILRQRGKPHPSTGAPDATPEDRVMLQVSLSGLAGFGRRIESHLERGVRGYRRTP